MKYTENFKKTMVQKMLLPGGPGVTRLSREIGVNKHFTIGGINIIIQVQEAHIPTEALDNGQKKKNMRHCWKPPV